LLVDNAIYLVLMIKIVRERTVDLSKGKMRMLALDLIGSPAMGQIV